MLRERRNFSNYATIPVVETQQKERPEVTDEITIKFVGDMDQNIADIVGAMRCSENVREEIKSILKIYARKIVRLREERNFYKEMLVLREDAELQENVKLRQAVKVLEEQLAQRSKDNCERCTCFEESAFRSSKFTEDQQGMNRFSRASLQSYSNLHSQSQQLQKNEDELLIGSSKSSECKREDSLEVSESVKAAQPPQPLNASISQEELTKLMMKYNISTDQLQQIFEEYDRQNRQAYELFDSQRQRQLYRLGQRMQKDLWNRKIIKDIKRLNP